MRTKRIIHLLSVLLIAVSWGCSTNTAITEDTAAGNMEQTETFNEQHRLQFHFTPPSGWMNDPNGMVYHNGEYHLFYQHNPDSTVWGPMHWGHAVSKDMISWEHLPIALYPDSLGTIFSGSAVVDMNNTSGLGTKENPAMVAIYTYHDAEGERAGRDDFQTQGIAFSLDNGRSWTKYKNNPVLKNPGTRDFRDPKVMWYEEGQKWIMTLAVKDHISFYSSPNLLNWKLESDFGANVGAHGGVWECPDLFKLKTQDTDEEKWVLIVNINPGAPNGGSGTQYFLGSFDGNNFVIDPQFEASLNAKPVIATTVNGQEGIWLDYGRDEYAGVSWSGVPEEDGRRLFMGWMSNWDYANVVPTEKWRSAMAIARKLELVNTPAGMRVASMPVKELQNIYGTTKKLEAQTISNVLDISDKLSINTSTYDLQLRLEPVGTQNSFAVELSNAKNQKVLVGLDASRGQYYIDRTKSGDHSFSDKFSGIQYAPRLSNDKAFDLRLVVDVASVELFADSGKTVMTAIFFPDEEFTKVKLVTENGQLKLVSGQMTDLKSIYSSAE
ncbi:glycoside hydrolase family 32 protein [Pontibacter toksunensis]|uniref:Glycoside hydrolase family 32 protein n=1 Tax=Pontibacter toksunensis TaxID=1332631 RepID=A0ABW6BZC4_9BACT